MPGGCECLYLEDLLTQYQPSARGRVTRCHLAGLLWWIMERTLMTFGCVWFTSVRRAPTIWSRKCIFSQEADGPHLYEQGSASTATRAPSFPSCEAGKGSWIPGLMQYLPSCGMELMVFSSSSEIFVTMGMWCGSPAECVFSPEIHICRTLGFCARKIQSGGCAFDFCS